MLSMASEAPIPHSPPIATPNRKRSTSRLSGSARSPRRLEHREEHDVDHQDRPPPEAVGEQAEDEGAERARGEGQEDA